MSIAPNHVGHYFDKQEVYRNSGRFRQLIVYFCLAACHLIFDNRQSALCLGRNRWKASFTLFFRAQWSRYSAVLCLGVPTTCSPANP